MSVSFASPALTQKTPHNEQKRHSQSRERRPTLPHLWVLPAECIEHDLFFLAAGHRHHYQADYTLVAAAVSAILAVTGLLQLIIRPMSGPLRAAPVNDCQASPFSGLRLRWRFRADIETFLAIRMLQAGCCLRAWCLSRAFCATLSATKQAARMIGYVSHGH